MMSMILHTACKPSPRSHLFPTEILSLIFDFACTDIGKTARSLSLVSYFVRALTKPLLFRSIFAYGTKNIETFALRLSQDPLLPRSVRNLFLSRKHIAPLESANFVRIFLHTIALVAPSLESFCCFNLPLVRITDTPFPTSFSNLRELTIKDYSHMEPVKITLPSLERLHLYTWAPSASLENLASNCPQITHLRFSGFTFGGRNLVTILQQAWGIPLATPLGTSLAENGVKPFALPPRLRSIILQPGAVPEVSGFGRGYRSIIKDLVELAETEEARAYGFVIQEPVDLNECFEPVMADWLDRLDGGHGCWEVKNRLI